MPFLGDKHVDFSKLNSLEISKLPNDQLAALAENVLNVVQEDRQQAQLYYYEPASKDVEKVHKSDAHLLGVSGGNGSSKTESQLVEIISLATGILPYTIQDDIQHKFRGPINARVVVESLTNTLETVILPKLQWWKWTGVEMPGGARGHWGWIPKMSLIDGSWEKSWSARNRTLNVLCKDPNEPDKVLGISTISFMSHDQDPQDFASGDFHEILLDEPPRLRIFRECQARTMRVKGRLRLAMTWPDDPTIPVDWIYDEIYDKGKPGPNKTPDVEWYELLTTNNKMLDQEAIAAQMSKWSKTEIELRIKGQPLRFSNRIHPLFTDTPQVWSHDAGKVIFPDDEGKCPETGSYNVVEFCHVLEREINPSWPVCFIIDPHPRKPHMFQWVQITPADDYYVVADAELSDSPGMVWMRVQEIEDELGLNTVLRLMDPNMGASPASAQRREASWQDEFADAGLYCDLADDSSVGRQRINEFLKPDQFTGEPRLLMHPRATGTIFQMKRYVWDNYRNQDERDLKQKPKEKYDDYPTMLKYLMNAQPEFRSLLVGPEIIRSRRKGAY